MASERPFGERAVDWLSAPGGEPSLGVSRVEDDHVGLAARPADRFVEQQPVGPVRSADAQIEVGRETAAAIAEAAVIRAENDLPNDDASAAWANASGWCCSAPVQANGRSDARHDQLPRYGNVG